MRVAGNKIIRADIEIGKVATTATGDENFFANPFVMLQHRHRAPVPPCGHRAKQPGASRANDDDIKPSTHFVRANLRILLLSKHLFHGVAAEDDGFFFAAVVAVSEAMGVETEGVEEGGVEIGHGNGALGGDIADGVGGADGLAALGTATGEPAGVAGG